MKTLQYAVAVLLLAGMAVLPAPAQLAITEVMAESSRLASSSRKEPDYWELTNFGNTNIHLHGYGFRDNNPLNFTTNPFDQLEIGAGESVIFFRSNVVFPTAEAFKSWWGEANLPTNLQVRSWMAGGLDGDATDEVWLFDASSNRVTSVAFGRSLRGQAFTYSPDTGVFGSYSVPEVNGALRAASVTNDIGSPGRTIGPVSLSIPVPPASQTVDGCDKVQFTVLFSGIPEPRYQWSHNGVPIPGAIEPVYVIPDVNPSLAGEYRVLLDNGLMRTSSAPAVLTVFTNPLAPRVVRAPSDSVVFPGQTATFSIETRGFPCLSYQWRSNGVPIAGATDRSLSISIPVDASASSNNYSVTAWNDSGSTNASASLVVTRRPSLKITEVMPSPNSGAELGHKNWIELTNCESNAVDLLGYRFRDSYSLEVASTITNSLVITPGESVILVEAMSAEKFREWWGSANLPPDLKIITWGGWGLSASGDDPLVVWNPGATVADRYDTVATASFQRADNGISQELQSSYYPVDGSVGVWLRDNRDGAYGAFRAAQGDDIGSPGYAVFPRVLGISKNGPTVSVRCLVEPTKTYRLLANDSLPGGAWTPVTDARADNNWLITIIDTAAAGIGHRFYRLEELP